MKHIAPVLGTALSCLLFACGGAPGGTEPVGSVDTPATSVQKVDAVDEPVAAGSAAGVGFVPAQGCDGVTGTWRGQVFSPPHAGYYEFTLHVAEATPGGGELTGSIVARSWQGEVEDVAPPEVCGAGYHWTVAEEAAGRVREDHTLSFGGTSWKVGEHLCGERVSDYSLDQVSVVLPEGDLSSVSRLSGAVSDSVVWVGDGMPIELTRVACD